MTVRPPATPATDDQLARVIARRDESPAAWRAAQDACLHLYQRHARPLLAFLSARARRGEVEDLHQVVWERVWQAAPAGFHGGNFRAWLYRIARNCLIDQARQARPQPLGEELSDPRGERAEERLAEQERMAVLRRCLERLGTEGAELVRQRLAGASYEEICARLGLRPERAHKLFHQAKEQLQACVRRALA